MHYVVAYDIEKDRRRTRVMNTLKDFGFRVQYSVFECELTAAKMAELEARLRGLIDQRRDKVNIYPLCETCFYRAKAMGAESREGLE